MSKILRLVGVVVLSAVTANAASIMGNGAPYQEYKGYGGSFAVPYMTKKPVLDGTMAAGEWDGALYTEWGPSDLAVWGEKYGFVQNEPGAVRADGMMSQLLTSTQEDPSEGLTDLDSYSRLWAGWDEDYFYEAFKVTDSVYDVTGTQDAGFWERDGFFVQLDFGTATNNFCLLAFSAMPTGSARYSIYAWFPERSEPHFFGDEVDFFDGTNSGFTLTDDGWLLETRASWVMMNKYLPDFKVKSGVEFGNCYHTLDPDGEDGFGGQFQFASGKNQGDPTEWARWTLVGGPGATAVENSTWGNLKQLLAE